MPAPNGGTVTSLSDMAAYLRSQNPSQGYSSGAAQRDVTRFESTFAPQRSIFGPGYPLVPTTRQSIRNWDYPTAWNTSFTPRSYEPISFGELRSLADKHTLTRLAVETRKDQIEALPWQIRVAGNDGLGRALKASKEQQGRIGTLTKFFRYPDGTHRFETWLRHILDDLLVIDAPTVELRQTRGGKLIALDPLDGGTIKVLLDETGRRPKSPAPAYQQIIHGRPWVLLEDGTRADIAEGTVYADFNDGELIYMPRNLRTYKGYGFSPCEQIFTYMQIGIRRESRQLAHFTEGNIPPGMIDAPEGSTPEQVKEWQTWFDSTYGGNDSARTRLVWGPSGAKYQPFSEPPFKDDFDVWLARVVCNAFSLPASWATAQVNRATAQTAQETALEEGLFPLKLWVVGFLNLIIQQRMKHDDLEFCWDEKVDADPAVQATILTGYVKEGVYTRNEAREMLGKDPIEGGDNATVDTGQGPVLVSDVEALSDLTAHPPEPAPPAAVSGVGGAAGEKPAPGTGKPASTASSVGRTKGKPAPTGKTSAMGYPLAGGLQAALEVEAENAAFRAEEVAKEAGAHPFGEPASRHYLATARDAIAEVVTRFFREEAPRIASDVLGHRHKTSETETSQKNFTKAADHTNPDRSGVEPLADPHRAREISAAAASSLLAIEWSRWSGLAKEISPLFEAAAVQTVVDTLAALPGEPVTEAQLEAAKAEARKWARDRAAELVGRSNTAGRTIPDASAENDITDSTARMIAEPLRRAIAERSTAAELTTVLRESPALSPARAKRIADTETKTALHTATMRAFKASGRVKGSYWVTVHDERVESACLINELASPVRLGHPFPSGHTAPLAHNNCRCYLTPWM